MNTAVLFSRAKDEWQTPPEVFKALDAEFGFTVDCAASTANHYCDRWYGPGGISPDALAVAWGAADTVCWLNPPYSHVRAFISKAASEARTRGCTVVALVPARTDTRWWHDHVYDQTQAACRPGVSVRFLKGRLRFVGASSGAPFPSVVIVFRAPQQMGVAVSATEECDR